MSQKSLDHFIINWVHIEAQNKKILECYGATLRDTRRQLVYPMFLKLGQNEPKIDHTYYCIGFIWQQHQKLKNF